MRDEAALAARLLAQGRGIDRLSRPLTIVAFAAVMLAPLVQVPRGSLPVLALVGLAGLAQAWFARRVALDAALFASLAEGRPPASLEALDAALRGAGLLPAAKAGRPIAPRIAGARRLLRWQAVAFLLQVALVLASPMLA
jgi:hypothetical protein